ncbi:MAG: V-type ATPase subunit subunit G family protein [Thermoplasmatales archaeon]
MTQDIEVLKKIKEKEDESRRDVEDARKKAEQIINNARAEAERISREAEIRGSTLYKDYIKSKTAEATEEAARIKKEYEKKVANIKKNVSQEVVENMFKIVVR